MLSWRCWRFSCCKQLCSTIVDIYCFTLDTLYLRFGREPSCGTPGDPRFRAHIVWFLPAVSLTGSCPSMLISTDFDNDLGAPAFNHARELVGRKCCATNDPFSHAEQRLGLVSNSMSRSLPPYTFSRYRTKCRPVSTRRTTRRVSIAIHCVAGSLWTSISVEGIMERRYALWGPDVLLGPCCQVLQLWPKSMEVIFVHGVMLSTSYTVAVKAIYHATCC